MTDLMEKALAAVKHWPSERQEEAAELLLALDRLGSSTYRADPDELRAIDEACEQCRDGQTATEDEVKAAYRRFAE